MLIASSTILAPWNKSEMKTYLMSTLLNDSNGFHQIIRKQFYLIQWWDLHQISTLPKPWQCTRWENVTLDPIRLIFLLDFRDSFVIYIHKDLFFALKGTWQLSEDILLQLLFLFRSHYLSVPVTMYDQAKCLSYTTTKI